MSIVACPKCNEEISIPHASPLAHVRCPLCLDEYPLAEVLDKLPPSLVVLDDPGTGGGGEPTGRPGDSAIHAFSAATGAADQQHGGGGFDFQQRSAGTATEAKPSVGPRPRRRQRKPKKPLVEVLKIVGGGAVGIIVAILIIWWVAGKDPFKLAPKVASFAPFLVPDHLYKDDSDDAKDEQGDGASETNNPKNKSGGTPQAKPPSGSLNDAFKEKFPSDDTGTQADGPVKKQPKSGSQPKP